MDEIAPGYRRFQFQAHMVFYSERGAFVLINAVLHRRQHFLAELRMPGNPDAGPALGWDEQDGGHDDECDVELYRVNWEL